MTDHEASLTLFFSLAHPNKFITMKRQRLFAKDVNTGLQEIDGYRYVQLIGNHNADDVKIEIKKVSVIRKASVLGNVVLIPPIPQAAQDAGRR